jgi:hypothetical protein
MPQVSWGRAQRPASVGIDSRFGEAPGTGKCGDPYGLVYSEPPTSESQKTLPQILLGAGSHAGCWRFCDDRAGNDGAVAVLTLEFSPNQTVERPAPAAAQNDGESEQGPHQRELVGSPRRQQDSEADHQHLNRDHQRH